MARLINDSGVLGDAIEVTNKTVADVPFDKVIEAINVIQTRMGITGTTAKEAGRTIAGSVGSMKAAWTNLITGLADGNADIETLVENLVTTIVGDGTENNLGVLGNIMPAVKMALKGAAEVVAQAAPIFAEQLPGLIEEILPDLASATANLIVALAEQIPSMAETLVDAAIQIVDEIGNAFAERIPGLSVIFENLETVVISLTAAFVAYKAATAISGIIDALRKATEGQTIAQALLNSVMNANPFVLIATLIAGLVAAIITLWNTNEGFRNAIIGAWDAIKNAAVVVWESIVKFFTETIPNALSNAWEAIKLFFTETIPNAFNSFVQWFKDLPETIAYNLGLMIGTIVKFFSELPGKIWEWLVNVVTKFMDWKNETESKIKEFVPQLIDNIVNFFKELPGKIWNCLIGVVTKFMEWRSNMEAKIKNFIPKMIDNIVNFFKELPSKIKNIGKNIVEGLWEGLKNAWSWLKDKVGGLFGNLVQGIKDGLGIHSPSRLFRDEIGKMMALGLGEGWDDEFSRVKDDMEDALNFDDASVGINASIRKVGAGVAGGAFGGTSIGNITINIDGAKYNDEQSLASAIALEIQNMTDRRAAVYA